jgi:hypothetical protein
MSNGLQVRTLAALTSQSALEYRPLLVLHDLSAVRRMLPTPRKSSFFKSFTRQGAGEVQRCQSVRFTRLLPLQPGRVESRPGIVAAGWSRRPGLDEPLQARFSVESHFSSISPAHPRSLASVLIPRPAARRVSASASRPRRSKADLPGTPFAALRVTAFKKSFQQIPSENADEKIFRTFRKSAAWHLGAGHLASLRARVSRG